MAHSCCRLILSHIDIPLRLRWQSRERGTGRSWKGASTSLSSKRRPFQGTHVNGALVLQRVACRSSVLMRRALAIDEASYGKDHPAVARELNNLARGATDSDRGRYSSVQSDDWRHSLGPDPNSLADPADNLGPFRLPAQPPLVSNHESDHS